MKTIKAVKPIGGAFAGCCRYEAFSFGSIRLDGVTYEHDVVIDRGEVRKRKKKPATLPWRWPRRPSRGGDHGRQSRHRQAVPGPRAAGPPWRAGATLQAGRGVSAAPVQMAQAEPAVLRISSHMLEATVDAVWQDPGWTSRSWLNGLQRPTIGASTGS